MPAEVEPTDQRALMIKALRNMPELKELMEGRDPAQFSVVSFGEVRGVSWIALMSHRGYDYGLGYVHVPDGHPLAGMHYDDMPEEVGGAAHGYVTYSKGNWFGFDTAHAGDIWPGTPELLRLGDEVNWNEERLTQATIKFATVMADYDTPRLEKHHESITRK